MRLQPQRTGTDRRIDTSFFPPRRFIATAMNLTMVSATERDRELVADFAAERRCLGKAQMMGIGGTAAADQARLLGNRFDVIAIANAPQRRQRQHGLVDHGRPSSSFWPAPLRSFFFVPTSRLIFKL